MKKGIVLIALGKRGYSFAAYNMAASIKYFNPAIHITVLTDGLKQLYNEDYFDDVILLPELAYHHNGFFSPGKIKAHIYEHLPYEHNIYLDVDGCVLKDITPLFDYFEKKKGFYFTQVMGEGKKGENIAYDLWANHADAWEFFNLKPDTIWRTLQSSFCFIKKQKQAEKFFGEIAHAHDTWNLTLKTQWGKCLPDELFYTGICAKKNLNPDAGIEVTFFGKDHVDNYQQIIDKHYVLSLWGAGGGQKIVKLRYVTWYDALMKKYTGNHIYKSHYIMDDKWISQK